MASKFDWGAVRPEDYEKNKSPRDVRMKRLVFLIFSFVLLFGFATIILSYNWEYLIPYESDLDLGDDPLQRKVINKEPWEYEGYEIQPLASFDTEVLILSRKDYYNDFLSKLSPTDLAVSWGPMTKIDNLVYLRFYQRDRYTHFQIDNRVPVENPGHYIGNFHLIPGNDDVRNVLARVDPWETVEIRGYLVGIYKNKKYGTVKIAKSSLSRIDTDCEVIWVETMRRTKSDGEGLGSSG